MGKLLQLQSLTKAFNVLRRCYGSAVMMNYSVWKTSSVKVRSPPIVILHGLMSSEESWRDVARSIISHGNHMVYTLDARNHGRSPHTSEFSFQLMAADILHFMEALRLPKIIALGHGMGGLGMMTFAMSFPQLVHRLILVDVSPFEYPRSANLSDACYDYLETVELSEELTIVEARQIVRETLVDICGNEFQATYISRNLIKLRSGRFSWAVNFPAIRSHWNEFENFHYTLSGLQPYPGPTLLIAGSRSTYVRRSHVSQMIQYFPNMQVEWMEAYHLVHYDRPAQFVEYVVDFCVD